VKDSFEMPLETTQDDEEYGSDEDIVPSAAGGHASSPNLDVVNKADPSEQEERSVSPVKGSPAPNPTRPLGKREGRSDESQGEFPTPTPKDTQNSPVKPRSKTADAGSASSPVRPAAPSQSSQKTKKEKEREEEEAWEKRREEMKRKMQTGTAGGTNLGRRRLAR
jgi:hypothetical protein